MIATVTIGFIVTVAIVLLNTCMLTLWLVSDKHSKKYTLHALYRNGAERLSKVRLGT